MRALSDEEVDLIRVLAAGCKQPLRQQIIDGIPAVHVLRGSARDGFIEFGMPGRIGPATQLSGSQFVAIGHLLDADGVDIAVFFCTDANGCALQLDFSKANRQRIIAPLWASATVD